MFNLIFVGTMAILGTYDSLHSCEHAIREIYAQKMNPPNQRLKELEESIDFRAKNQKIYMCVPKKS
jgi:hypothetical protein